MRRYLRLKKILISLGIKNVYKTFKLSKHYLEEVGWNNSVKKTGSIDKLGNPIPWFTYSSIHFLGSRLNENLTLFEFGSGNSTIWFSKRLKKVYSVEHDLEWFQKLDYILKDIPNVEYFYKNLFNGAYQNEILQHKNVFDIVVIDGRDRVNCCLNSITALKKNGVIIWDNSDRARYEEGFDFLNKMGFRRIDFWGIAPINHQECCTTIFYRSDNCLGI